MSGPFKMKGSPMQRNFGIGTSPTKHFTGEEHPEHEKTEEKTEIPVGTLNEDGTKRWDGTNWVLTGSAKDQPKKK